MIVPLLQVMQVLESQMSGQPVKPEVSAEERVERCREKQGLLESRCRHLFCFCSLIFLLRIKLMISFTAGIAVCSPELTNCELKSWPHMHRSNCKQWLGRMIREELACMEKLV